MTYLEFIGRIVLAVILGAAIGLERQLTGHRAGIRFVALPGTYFAYLIPCILLYMCLATSLKKAYVKHFGELL